MAIQHSCVFLPYEYSNVLIKYQWRKAIFSMLPVYREATMGARVRGGEYLDKLSHAQRACRSELLRRMSYGGLGINLLCHTTGGFINWASNDLVTNINHLKSLQ